MSVADDSEEFEEETAFNWPTLYIDGEAAEAEYDLGRVQVEFSDSSNGAQSEAQERSPLGWCNSAAITLDRDDDAVHVSISVGDPRGAFCFTVRRLRGGSMFFDNKDLAGRLVMHVPYPGEGMPHETLTRWRDGTYLIGEPMAAE